MKKTVKIRYELIRNHESKLKKKDYFNVPEESGIYLLYDEDEICYVGGTRKNQNLRSRIKAAVKSETKIWTNFSWYQIADNDSINDLKVLLLKIIKPKPRYNIKIGKFPYLKKMIVILLAMALFSCRQKSVHDREIETINSMFPNGSIIIDGQSQSTPNLYLISSTGGGMAQMDYVVRFKINGDLRDTIGLEGEFLDRDLKYVDIITSSK